MICDILVCLFKIMINIATNWMLTKCQFTVEIVHNMSTLFIIRQIKI